MSGVTDEEWDDRLRILHAHRRSWHHLALKCPSPCSEITAAKNSTALVTDSSVDHLFHRQHEFLERRQN